MDKYIPAKVTPATAQEEEWLTCLIEEASEVIKAASKIKRSGFGHIPPLRETTNRDELQVEIGDFLAIYSILFSHGVIDQSRVEQYRQYKLERLPFFLLES